MRECAATYITGTNVLSHFSNGALAANFIGINGATSIGDNDAELLLTKAKTFRGNDLSVTCEQQMV